MDYTSENPNTMGINQLGPILNEIVKQATGTTPAAVVDESSFVSVAQTALLAGYDPMTQAISQVLSRTIFSMRPYSAKFQALNVSGETYGNHVRKLQTVDKEMETDDRLTLTDGESVDMYRVNKPEVVQTNFYGENQYQKSLTIYRDQLDTAFSSSTEFSRFISMVMQNASDQITQAKEETARAVLTNLIGATIDLNNGSQVIDVLEKYNDFAGTTLTAETVFNPGNIDNFVRWLYSFIQNVSDFMTERCALYHAKIGDKIIMRHTPKPDQRLYLYNPLVRTMESVVTSTTYHDEKTVFPSYEGVNYWQSIQEPTLINVVPAAINDAGEYVKGAQVNTDSVIGVLFDREAAGMTPVNEWSGATPFNVRGGYYNNFWHFTERYWNDFSENCIVFTLGNTNGVSPTRAMSKSRKG